MTPALALLLLAVQADTRVDCPPSPDPAADSQPQAHGRGLWIGGIAFAKGDIADAIVASDQYTNEPTVAVRFTATGRAKFGAAQRCRLNKPIEIWIDDQLISRPFLIEFITGAEVMIAGNFTQAEAVTFAARLSPTKL